MQAPWCSWHSHCCRFSVHDRIPGCVVSGFPSVEVADRVLSSWHQVILPCALSGLSSAESDPRPVQVIWRLTRANKSRELVITASLCWCGA